MLTGIIGSLSLGAVSGLVINAIQMYAAHRSAIKVATKAVSAARVGSEIRERIRQRADSPVKAKTKPSA